MKSIWLRWLINSTIGQFLAVVLAVALARWYYIHYGEPGKISGKIIFLSVMLLAGVLQGTIIAVFQWPIIKSKFDKLPLHKWWRATVSVTLLIWFIGMLPALYVPLDPAINKPEVLPLPRTIMMISAILGMAIGFLFGWFQWLPLRRYASNAGRWIWTTALSWTAGNVWTGVAYLYWYQRESTAETIGFSLACAFLLSLSISLISGWGLRGLRER